MIKKYLNREWIADNFFRSEGFPYCFGEKHLILSLRPRWPLAAYYVSPAEVDLPWLNGDKNTSIEAFFDNLAEVLVDKKLHWLDVGKMANGEIKIHRMTPFNSGLLREGMLLPFQDIAREKDVCRFVAIIIDSGEGVVTFMRELDDNISFFEIAFFGNLNLWNQLRIALGIS